MSGSRKRLRSIGFLVFFFASAIPTLSSQPRTIESLPVPPGFSRIAYPAGSFSRFIQTLPLKTAAEVRDYEGRLVTRGYDLTAVIDLPILFKTDLEQCADYCMRFWAEHHRRGDALNKLFLYDYNGRKKYFTDQNKTFRSFLHYSFSYANSHSLKVGGRPVRPEDLQPGDMFVQNETGGIGHVSMVVDACRNARGEKRYRLGFSFMPAQEFHLETAPDEYGDAGWFSYEGYCEFLKRFYPFGEPVLRRF